jgi:hypothetical protein
MGTGMVAATEDVRRFLRRERRVREQSCISARCSFSKSRGARVENANSTLSPEEVKGLDDCCRFSQTSDSIGGRREEVFLRVFFLLFWVDSLSGEFSVCAATTFTTAACECCRQVDFVLQGSERNHLREVPGPSARGVCDQRSFQRTESVGRSRRHDH